MAQAKPPADEARTPRDLRKGEISPEVRSAAKPDQSYALYVPTRYAPDQRWPIIYVFDPGARGRRPLELMKDGAERHGYLLAGSNNSRNGPWDPQREAATEMWNDTHTWLSIDDRRAYFAGLSGGARVSAQIAQGCQCARGVFLNSAGFGSGQGPSRDAVFDVFAMAGMTDFNYGELVELDARLEPLGFRHFLRRFEGGHEWAPPAVWDEAMAWTALLEMKDGRRPRDEGFVAAELARAVERARKLEDAGEPYLAWGEYRAAAGTLAGLTDAPALKERADALERNPAVRAGAKQERADIEKELRIEADLLRVTDRLRGPRDAQDTVLLDAKTRIRQLREGVLEEKRPAARRVLERALGTAFAAMIETGGPLLEAGRYSEAERYFQLAAEAHPDWAWPHLSLARCHASIGDRKGALRDLKHAREAGFTAGELADFVKANAVLAPLRDAPEFQMLLAGAPPGEPAPR